MELIVSAINSVLAITRVTLVWIAAVLAVVLALDWLVRTRRINPFSRLARTIRSVIDPVLSPIERRVVRSGGSPTTAPWWALGIIVIGGILLIAALSYIRDLLLSAWIASAAGPRGMLRVLVEWTFGLLQLALIVRVIASWFRVSPVSAWVRWSYVLTEWMLRPLRRIIPTIGMMDITPIVAYVLLQLCASAVGSAGL